MSTESESTAPTAPDWRRHVSRGARRCLGWAAVLVALYLVLGLLGCRAYTGVFAGLLGGHPLALLGGAAYGLLHVVVWFLVPPLVLGALASALLRRLLTPT